MVTGFIYSADDNASKLSAARKLYLAGKYDEAILAFKEKLKACTATKGAGSYEAGVTHCQLALTYVKSGDKRNALKNLEKALEIQKIKASPRESIFFKQTSVVVFIIAGKTDDSKIAAKNLFETVRKVHGADSADYIGRLEFIGTTYLIHSKSKQEVIYYYGKAIDSINKQEDPDNTRLVRLNNRLGLIYKEIGNAALALKYFNQSLKLLEKMRPLDKVKIEAHYREIYSLYLHHLNEYKKAHHILLSSRHCYCRSFYSA